MRDKYNGQLDELKQTIREMGALTIECAKGNIQLDKIEADWQTVVRMARELIMRQQPVSFDLALITGARQIAGDLARVAAQAAGVFEMTKDSSDESLSRMKSAVAEMLSLAMSAFANIDIIIESRFDGAKDERALDGARKAIAMDDEVDELFHSMKSRLADAMVTGGAGRDDAEKALDFMLAAKYCERMGDHIVNIARVVLDIAR